ncbi:MAG TPA: low affinity iron permease family protein [Rhodanobacteraceae bacterium]|nr:low affinity iron permease family protein [Rhodanobacteraceae bacterium]
MRYSRVFKRFAQAAARASGQPVTFLVAVAIVIVWGVSGPLFGYSDTWQLVINTGTTIITFLMVFLIQNTQNRDSEAVQIKLDELIRALEGAHNGLLDLEEMDVEMLESMRKRYRDLAEKARRELKGGKEDTGCEEIKKAPAVSAADAGVAD